MRKSAVEGVGGKELCLAMALEITCINNISVAPKLWGDLQCVLVYPC